jgi:hypothetical protein
MWEGDSTQSTQKHFTPQLKPYQYSFTKTSTPSRASWAGCKVDIRRSVLPLAASLMLVAAMPPYSNTTHQGRKARYMHSRSKSQYKTPYRQRPLQHGGATLTLQLEGRGPHSTAHPKVATTLLSRPAGHCKPDNMATYADRPPDCTASHRLSNDTPGHGLLELCSRPLCKQTTPFLGMHSATSSTPSHCKRNLTQPSTVSP